MQIHTLIGVAQEKLNRPELAEKAFRAALIPRGKSSYLVADRGRICLGLCALPPHAGSRRESASH